MDRLPLEALRVGQLADLKDHCLLFTVDEFQPFLFTGGKYPFLVPLSGQEAFNGYAAKEQYISNLLVVDGVEFEVDVETAEMSAYSDRPLGALIKSDAGSGIVAMIHSGFRQSLEVYFDVEDRPDRTGASFYFRSWKAFKRIGTQKFLLVEVDLAKRT